LLKNKKVVILGSGGAAKAVNKAILDLGGIPAIVSRNLDKAKLETLAAEMAKYTQTESGKTLPVYVEIELDRDMLPDEVLYKNTF
ncbi:MAG: hypothetical protein RR682_15195, partial [Cetobacterium sp.]|uniref:hypothetical protein n=1 Tax=Cetobacterium sp. TaxID=2071632 RepID=UPI002FCB620B